MRAIRTVAFSSIALLALSVTAAFAHHSYARFDLNKTVTLDGVVKEFQWTNPHVWIQVVAKDPATGAEVEWAIESDSPNMLARRGWSRKTLKTGDRVVIVAHPEKTTDARRAALDTLKLASQPTAQALR